MTETTQNWEEEFMKRFVVTSQRNIIWNIIENNNHMTYRYIMSFIHKVRTEAILEERKRIEEGLNNSRLHHIQYPDGSKDEPMYTRYDVLQIINNKNI